MRVISGKTKGHILKVPKSSSTRPTADRVKESIFNIIQMKLYDSIVLDLFAGSGSLGIEALSRNAYKAYFIDNNKYSIETIKKNLEKTGLINSAEIIRMDALNSIKRLNEQSVEADIIFLDPPYLEGFIESILKAISHYNILQPDGIAIVEHDTRDRIPDNIYRLEKYRTNKYGNVAVSFYHSGRESNEDSNLSREF